nr:hypothetical protein [Nocardioides convexus]
MHRALFKLVLAPAVGLGLTFTSVGVPATAAPVQKAPAAAAAPAAASPDCTSQKNASNRAHATYGRSVAALKRANATAAKALKTLKKAQAKKAHGKKAKKAKKKTVAKAKRHYAVARNAQAKSKANYNSAKKADATARSRYQECTAVPSGPAASPVQSLCDAGIPQPICDTLAKPDPQRQRRQPSGAAVQPTPRRPLRCATCSPPARRRTRRRCSRSSTRCSRPSASTTSWAACSAAWAWRRCSTRPASAPCWTCSAWVACCRCPDRRTTRTTAAPCSRGAAVARARAVGSPRPEFPHLSTGAACPRRAARWPARRPRPASPRRSSLRLPADGAYASVLRTLTAGLAARLDFTLDDIEDLRIAVSEAAAMVLDEADEGTVLDCRFRLLPGESRRHHRRDGTDAERPRLREPSAGRCSPPSPPRPPSTAPPAATPCG